MIQGVNPTIRAPATLAARETAPDEQQVRRGAGRVAVDSLELSEATQEQLDTGRDAQVRNELVQRVRTEIAQGSYLTDDKLERVVEGLVDELLGGI